MSKYYKTIGTIRILTIADFAQYRAFRKEWRENYKALSAQIRQSKTERKGDTMSVAQSQCHYLRIKARKEMELLAEAKEFAKTIVVFDKEEETE